MNIKLQLTFKMFHAEISFIQKLFIKNININLLLNVKISYGGISFIRTIFTYINSIEL